ncbi:MAG TPA: LamG-like jellyroll fold domain-containing protein, partial [Ardenticatenaceae bacterium]|nr:LamG-like jellyroll fold domain-containing protein [Ardenticatenaceae bacterium]
MAGLFVIGTVLVILQDQLGLGAGAVRALEGVNALIGTTLATAQFVAEVVKVSQAVRAAGGLSQIRMVSTFGRVGAVAALVVVALIVVTTVVMMILNWDNAVAVKTAFVQGTVTALIVVALFMIGLNFPIGTVVALLIALIDAVITLVCKIGNWTGGTDEGGQTFEAQNELLCGAIVNTVVNYVGGIFYRTQQIVDMAHPNRLQFGETRTRIIEQGNRPGLVGGNRLQITQPFTVTVRIPEDIDPVRDSDGEISAFDLGLNDMSVADYDDLIKGRHVFNYETIPSRDAPLDERLTWTASYSWKKFPASRADWRDWLYRDLEKSWDEELVAGINWHPPDVFLREYYKFYFAECGLFSVMIEIGCDYKSYQFTEFISGTQVIDLSEVLVYDVFPPTLSDFYTLEPLQVNGQTTNQYRLAWGGALPFPALADADGDGLRYASDPDDSRADTDGDGLPDAYEKQNGNLDASIPDIDGDGLTDYDEIRRGTRPDRADSDGDGLTDAREIEGWRFTYYDGGDTRRTVAVRSDPLLYDSDGDGHSDEDESIMGLNPHVHDGTVSALRLTTRTNDQDGYLTINQSIAFASTITNTLPERFAYGLLEAELLPTGQRFDPVPFALKPGAHRTLNGTIRTPSSAGDDDTTLTLRTRAGANVLEPGKDYAQALQGLPPPDTLEFQLNFEQVPSDERNFSDVTGNATITCEAASCPTVLRLPGGNSHSYASFEGQQRYRVASRQEIKAAGFSIGGWITPQDMFGTHVNERVILGPDPNGSARLGVQLSLAELQSGVPKAKVRVTGENGSVCERTFPELSVPFSQRTHVFVTVDGNTLRGYRNGREAGSFVCNVVPTGRELQIGAGDPAVVVTVERIDWTFGLEHADGNDSVELYLQWNDERNPFFSRDIDNGDDDTSINYTRRLDTVGTSNTIHICDSDEGDYRGKCESDGDNGDDKLGEVTFRAAPNTNIRQSFASDEGHYDDDVEGRLDIGVGNTFFNGSLDDLRIYSSSLSAEEVAGLAASAHLYYQLDEAAGQRQFRNAGLDVAQLECLASDNCPASGLPGYVGQAVRFSGNAREALRVRALGERFGSDFGLGFWLKPGTGRASAAPLPLLDYGIGLEGFTLWATQGVSQTILHAAFKNDTSEPAAPAATLPAAQWSHVAVVQQADRLYLAVNGEQQQMVVFDPARGGGYRLTAADQDTLVLGNGIKALLDEVQVRPSVEPRETTREIYEGSALLHLALDETPGSTRFASSTGRGELTCPTPTACPTAGVEGQVREGLEFDYRLEPASENAPHVGLPTALPLDTPFALSFWTRLPSAPTADMTLVALHSSQRNNDVSWRFELAPVGERTVPQLDFRVSGAQCGDNFAVEAPNDVALPLNQWLHLVLAYSPASSSARPKLTLFLNGRPVVRKELDQYVCTQGDMLRLGENFAGKLDEIYFYDRTLPESEILSLYHYQNTWYEDVSRQEFHFLIDTT